MTDTHLSTDELVIIESYFHQNASVSKISEQIGRARQAVHNVVTFLKDGHTALDFYKRYKANKQRCGRKQTVLSNDQRAYVAEKVAQGWTPDVIVGRREQPINCSSRTLYRIFKRKDFDFSTLPMKGKRKPNGHKERRGRQAFRRKLSDRKTDYPAFKEAFGHLEGDTIVGIHHKSAVVTLVERLSKGIITLKPEGRTAKDIDIYFADPGTPSQRGLNEHSNGLLRKDGLPKHMDFNTVDQRMVASVASKRNHIPRKSLNYQTPLEVLMSYMDVGRLSSLF